MELEESSKEEKFLKLLRYNYNMSGKRVEDIGFDDLDIMLEHINNCAKIAEDPEEVLAVKNARSGWQQTFQEWINLPTRATIGKPILNPLTFEQLLNENDKNFLRAMRITLKNPENLRK